MPNATILHEWFFNSLDDLVTYATDTDGTLPESYRASRTFSRADWSGTDSFTTARELALFGWPKGLKKIKSLTKDIVPKFYELFPRQDTGSELKHDVGGAYQDPVISDIGIDPLDMVNFKSNFDDIKQGNALQRLVIETGISASITPETLFFRGACILALLESLETFGFRIEVILQATVNKSSYGDKDNSELVVARTVLKTFEEHSDYDKFAFCIANAAFLRRLMFSVYETAPKDIVDKFGFMQSAGYSYPHNHPIYLDKDRDFYMVRPLENKTLIQCMDETVNLITTRYKGMVQTVENPELGDEGQKL